MANALDNIKLPFPDFSFKDGKVKGKKSRMWTCEHTGNTFVYTEGDSKSESDLYAFRDACENKMQDGYKTIKQVYGGWKGALQQAPDNAWITVEDTQRYGITKGDKPKIISDTTQGIGRITKLTGEVVYLRDSVQGLLPYIKTGNSNAKFPYIPAKDKSGKIIVEPYYIWAIKNETDPQVVATAKSKLSPQDVADIESGKYKYSAFEGALAGQIDLETAGNGTLDNVRYSFGEGDSRNLYTVTTPKTNVFVLNTDKNVVFSSHKKLLHGQKVTGVGEVEKTFKYKLPKVLKFGSSFISAKNLDKIEKGKYEVTESSRPFDIVGGKIKPSTKLIEAGTILEGEISHPVVEKQFSFVIIQNNDKKTLFVNKKHLQKMIGGTSSFEGGDVEDFYGGDVNFSGISGQLMNIDGDENVVGFDSNVSILGDLDGNGQADLSFDAGNDEEVSNTIGSFFKKIFGHSGDVTPDQAAAIADKNKVEYTPKEVQVMYEKSGTNQPFKDWLKSDESKSFLNKLWTLGSTLLISKSQGGMAADKSNAPDVQKDSSGSGNSSSAQTKILGMHPVTFTVVSVLSLIGIGASVWLLKRKK